MGITVQDLAKNYKNTEEETILKTAAFVKEWIEEEISRICPGSVVGNYNSQQNIDCFILLYSLFLQRLSKQNLPKSNTVFDLIQILYLATEEFEKFQTSDFQIKRSLNKVDSILQKDFSDSIIQSKITTNKDMDEFEFY